MNSQRVVITPVTLLAQVAMGPEMGANISSTDQVEHIIGEFAIVAQQAGLSAEDFDINIVPVH